MPLQLRGPVCFDARWQGRHGIGRFATEVAGRIDYLSPRFGRISPTAPLDSLFITWRVVQPNYALWFTPGFNVPLVHHQRYVFCVHDLIQIDVPGSGLARRAYFELLVKSACRTAAAVLTVSEFTRRRLLEWSGVHENQITNVGNGVSVTFNPLVRPLEPGFRYVLCVSNRRPHKNEARLVEAFVGSRIEKSVKLVFTGPSTIELLDIADRAGQRNRIVFLGEVEEGALAALYRGAEFLAFPSLYEGFGLPVIEAMACGTAVLTSNISALPEIAGDAAILIDPFSEVEIRKGMEELFENRPLRALLAERGMRRAALYSWDAVAQKVDAVLRHLLGS